LKEIIEIFANASKKKIRSVEKELIKVGKKAVTKFYFRSIRNGIIVAGSWEKRG